MRDPFASDLDQVPGGDLSHLHVIGPDKMRGKMGKVAVEEEVWRTGIPQFIKVSQIRLTRSDEENIHPTVEQGANLLPLQLWIFF
jgi:hypothetical protein